MFTGIIEEIGTIKGIERGNVSCRLSIQGNKVLDGSRVGDSIAVNGVCLTAATISGKVFTADVMGETLRRSNLGKLTVGSFVNLERAMAADGRFGGHIVSGHIDGTGIIKKLEREDNAVWVTVACDRRLLCYIIEKGSIAIDGISLTVAYVDDSCFRVSIIPHTASETTLLMKKAGDVVNLENDIIGKYVEKLMSTGALTENQGTSNSMKRNCEGIDAGFLAENGFM